MKQKEGNTYHWCIDHKNLTIHELAQCKLWPESKKKKVLCTTNLERIYITNYVTNKVNNMIETASVTSQYLREWLLGLPYLYTNFAINLINDM